MDSRVPWPLGEQESCPRGTQCPPGPWRGSATCPLPLPLLEGFPDLPAPSGHPMSSALSMENQQRSVCVSRGNGGLGQVSVPWDAQVSPLEFARCPLHIPASEMSPLPQPALDTACGCSLQGSSGRPAGSLLQNILEPPLATEAAALRPSGHLCLQQGQRARGGFAPRGCRSLGALRLQGVLRPQHWDGLPGGSPRVALPGVRNHPLRATGPGSSLHAAAGARRTVAAQEQL